MVQITQRQNKDDEKLNNDSQITTQMRNVKIEDHENPLTNGFTQLLNCSGMESSCFTSGTRHVTHVRNPVTRKLLDYDK